MKKQRGFSLLELLCVLAILSILSYVGSSHVLTLSQNTQDQSTLKNQMKRLADALTQARELAVVSGQTSFVCGGTFQNNSCDGDWSSGFTLYQESSVSSSDFIFLIEVLDDVSLSWSGFPVKKQQIEFYANGLSGYQNGTFQFCLGVWQSELILNQSGRFYLTDPQAKTESCL